MPEHRVAIERDRLADLTRTGVLAPPSVHSVPGITVIGMLFCCQLFTVTWPMSASAATVVPARRSVSAGSQSALHEVRAGSVTGAGYFTTCQSLMV